MSTFAFGSKPTTICVTSNKKRAPGIPGAPLETLVRAILTAIVR